MTHTDPDALDMIIELTRPRTNAEPYTIRRPDGTTWTVRHRTAVPSLVQQLLHAGNNTNGTGNERGALTSKPAARIDVLDTLILIDHEAAQWLRQLGQDDPGDHLDPTTGQHIPGTGTTRCLTALAAQWPTVPHCTRHHGLSPREETRWAWCCPRHHLDHDIRRWWRQARIISGWDTPAYRPFNTCPICEHRGGLRINLDIGSALCTECREVWDPTNIGLLADHIRNENLDTDTPNPEALADEPEQAAY